MIPKNSSDKMVNVWELAPFRQDRDRARDGSCHGTGSKRDGRGRTTD